MVGRRPLRGLVPPYGQLLGSVVGVVARLGAPVEFAAERRVVAPAADAGELEGHRGAADFDGVSFATSESQKRNSVGTF